MAENTNNILYTRLLKTKELKPILKDLSTRLMVYQYMRDKLLYRESMLMPAGFCHVCPPLLKPIMDNDISTRIKVLPELWKHKPKSVAHCAYWFSSDDYKTRLKILDSIIEKISKK